MKIDSGSAGIPACNSQRIFIIVCERSSWSLLWNKTVIPLDDGVWSPDSEWLVCSSEVELRFFNLADGRELDTTPPWKAVGRVENHFGWLPDGKMLFYRPSYEPKPALKTKILHSAGAPFRMTFLSPISM